jgi:hypothetical protein
MQEISPLGQRRHQRHLYPHAPRVRLQQHARVPRMHRKPQHPPPRLRDAPFPGRRTRRTVDVGAAFRRRLGRSQRAEIGQQRFRPRERLGVRRLEPGKPATSSMPLAFSVSTTSDRSSRRISGSSCAARCACSFSVHRRTQTPGAVRPARPARWSALAREIFSISSVLMPRCGSNRAIRARPRPPRS